MSAPVPAVRVCGSITFELDLRGGRTAQTRRQAALAGQPVKLLAILLQSAGIL